MKEHENMMDETNRRKSICSDRSVSIGTQDTHYYYNDVLWNPT